jgi:predicted small lipoprotein YifL
MRLTPRAPSFVAGVVAATLALAGCGSSGSQLSPSDRDTAVDKAQAVYRDFAASGQDLNRGPCISNGLAGLPDWVVDIAHDPRQDVDDDPANQCSRYRDGQAHHFVELDQDGTLIRAE